MPAKGIAPPLRHHYGRRESVVRKLAETLDRTEGGIQQSLHGPDSWRHKIMLYVRLLQDNGAHAKARAYIQPIADLVRETPIMALDVPLIAKAQTADAREDIAQAIAQASGSVTDLEAYLKALDAEAAAQAEVRAAVWSEIQARKGQA